MMDTLCNIKGGKSIYYIREVSNIYLGESQNIATFEHTHVLNMSLCGVIFTFYLKLLDYCFKITAPFCQETLFL